LPEHPPVAAEPFERDRGAERIMNMPAQASVWNMPEHRAVLIRAREKKKNKKKLMGGGGLKITAAAAHAPRIR
jgi:hypothetical protein